MADPRSEGRIFVSSTCLDLIDLRAELNQTLKEAGLTPVMSDQPDSDFANPGDRNAIATCLQNLRSCERCVLVLSRRYGARLGSAGFDDVSTTHLEYREAVGAGIPIHVYVRDKLLGDYQYVMNNPDAEPAWTTSEDGKGLFALLDEHKARSQSDPSNWVWLYTSSVDLCDRVLKDLGASSSAAAIRMLARRGLLPDVTMHVTGRSGDEFTVSMMNVGRTPCLSPQVRHPQGSLLYQRTELPAGVSSDFKLYFGPEHFSQTGGRAAVARMDYIIPTGEHLMDLFALLPSRENGLLIVKAGRMMIGASLALASPEVTIHGGLSTVEMEPINGMLGFSARSHPLLKR